MYKIIYNFKNKTKQEFIEKIKFLTRLFISTKKNIFISDHETQNKIDPRV